jgi:hypothetical protein
MRTFNYKFDNITGLAHPALYPGESSEKWVLPEDIRTDHGKLNSIIETKYTREFLKICAFYNKMFPSLKTSNWTRSFYNVPPFTAIDQERSDTGTGISSNYLKQIVDQVVSRLGTITFDPTILADVPTLAYIIYKDEVERLLRKMVRDDELNQVTMEVFHDAAVLGYSHVFIDPVTHKMIKASDYEIGFFESQFNRNSVKQMLYRDYAFPVTELVPYIAHEDKETQEQIIEEYGNKTTVDFKLYFDCTSHKVHATIGNTTITAFAYPFDEVQMITFSWDNGFSKVTSTSLFDLLYPVQRELNKVNAKLQQLIRMYKGAVPVFNSDVDISMKAISNGSGEALYVESARPIDTLMTVINPTPLDAALSAEKTAYKTEMYELAGIQQMSFDMENMRSAAAVIALDQTRDSVFQAQLMGISNFIKKVFKMWVNYNAVVQGETKEIDWPAVKYLVDNAFIDLTPVHLNDPLSNQGQIPDMPEPDYQQMQVARYVREIIKGNVRYEDLTFLVDIEAVKMIAATTLVKIDGLGIEIPEPLVQFLIAAFIEDIQTGVVQLVAPPPEMLPPEVEEVPSGE